MFSRAPGAARPGPVALAIATLALSLPLAGCGPRRGGSASGTATPSARSAPAAQPIEPIELGAPLGTVFTSHAAVCAPDRRWQALDGGVWQFRGEAAIICWVRSADASALSFTFATDASTAPHPFLLLWDGKPLSPDVGHLGTSGTTVSLPPGPLAPGRHELTLQRLAGPGPPHPAEWFDSRFTRLSFAVGAEAQHFATGRRSHYVYLTDFVQLGLVGLSPQKRRGWLFDGPRTEEVAATFDAPGALHVEVENASSGRATFRLGAGGKEETVTLAAGAGGELSLPVARGRERIAFAVEAPRETGETGEMGEGKDDGGLFLWGSSWLEPLGEPQRDRRHPPIILITLDTTRRDALDPYNTNTDLTPAIDAFARGATVFENAFSTAPWTLPAHASMLTGLYPSHHGAGVSADRLDVPNVTAADLLDSAGYFTAGFAGGELCASRFGIGKGFERYRDPEGFETRGDHLTDAVIGLLQRRPPRPLFLFVNYFDPHALYRAPEDLQEKTGVDRYRPAIRKLPIWKELDDGNVGAWQAVILGKAERVPVALDYMRASYLAEVAFMDRQIGRLFRELRREGLYDDALIILVADHGELLGEGGFFSHAFRLDPELVEVPLLVKWPGQHDGGRVASLTSVVDVFPTLLAAAGIEPPPSDARLLSPAGPAHPETRPFVLMEEHESRVHPLPGPMRIAGHLYGIQKLGSRRVVWQGGQSCAGRQRERWRPTPCPGNRAAVLHRLLSLLGPPQETQGPPVPPLSQDEVKALKALGYL